MKERAAAAVDGAVFEAAPFVTGELAERGKLWGVSGFEAAELVVSVVAAVQMISTLQVSPTTYSQQKKSSYEKS